jgi:tetratricopeptide (TPR) repeat protein
MNNNVQDEMGLAYTTESAEAPSLFLNVVDHYLGSSAETMPALELVLEKDPAMPMALMFRGYLLKLAADPRFRAPIQKCYEAVAARTDLNDREQRHLKAFSFWQQDDMDNAVKTFDDIVNDYPHDMLALRVAHYLHFYGSGATPMTNSLSQVLELWQPGDRFYGYLKGMQSFALEESGDYEQAESIGLEALDINRADIWAAHAVTHVYQMQSRFDEGIPFLESLTGEWDNANNFVYHLHWHKALQHIGLGDQEAALKVYDDLLVAPLADDFYLDVCNAASLLWRLEMLGSSAGDRWQQLLELSRNRVQDDELVFTTLHYLMAPAILGDTPSIESGLNHFHAWSQAGTTQGKVASQVGETMAQSIACFAKQQHREGALLLQTVKDKIHLIGGSHAQRHLFDQLITTYH